MRRWMGLGLAQHGIQLAARSITQLITTLMGNNTWSRWIAALGPVQLTEASDLPPEPLQRRRGLMDHSYSSLALGRLLEA